MNRKLVPFGVVPLILVLSLTGCSSAPVTPTAALPSPGGNTTPAPVSGAASNPTPDSSSDLARTDSQGAVEFVVTPRNLASPGETLDFDVSMNTHSVNLAWDLAAQSTLATDTGLEVQGKSWPVGSGHHYEDTLTFPVKTADGKALLEGAKTLTLTIRDAGVPERVFKWELSK